METVSEETRGRAWLEAITILRNQRSMVYNLIVEIREPGLASVINKAAQDELDTLLVSASDHVCDTVAETIFPAWEYKRHGADGVYSVYPDEVYPAISSLRRNVQREFMKRLGRLALGHSSAPEDCQTVAYSQLTLLEKKMTVSLEGNAKLDSYSRSHLEESSARIRKVLEAKITLFGI